MSNLDPERLSSLNEFGEHKHIIPAEVKGFWRRQRNWTQYVLILIFLILPWTKMNGVQTILLDIPRRQFAIFGITFWAHDAPLIFFLLAISALSLFLVTSVWGRVWCGWACPQTVFIDGVFRKIEILIEGNYIKRRELENAPLSFEKFWKWLLKWFLFFVVASGISHCFAAYFVGSENLIKMIQGNPAEHWDTFVVVTFITIVVLFDFGWFREQFCIIMCPYGRFQSVLLDKNSVTVMYDSSRGEPRKGLPVQNGRQGDCVSCNRCVQVCPTGIDIRKGLQMECIACTACIDACDEIMEKVHKPKGLVRYSSISGEKFNFTRARSVIYLILIVAAAAGLAWNIFYREPMSYTVIRGTDTPYQIIKNELGESMIINHFKVHLHNESFKLGRYFVTATEQAITQGIEITTPINPVDLMAGENKTIHVFVKFKPNLTQAIGQARTSVRIKDLISEPYFMDKDVTIVGPANFGK